MKNIILQANGKQLVENKNVENLLNKQGDLAEVFGKDVDVKKLKQVLGDAVLLVFNQKKDLFKKLVRPAEKKEQNNPEDDISQSIFNKTYKQILLEAEQEDEDEDIGQIFKITVKSPKSVKITKADGTQLNQDQLKRIKSALIEKDKNGVPRYKQFSQNKKNISVKDEKDDQQGQSENKLNVDKVLADLGKAPISFENLTVDGMEINKDSLKEIVVVASKKLNEDLKKSITEIIGNSKGNPEKICTSLSTSIAAIALGRAVILMNKLKQKDQKDKKAKTERIDKFFNMLVKNYADQIKKANLKPTKDEIFSEKGIQALSKEKDVPIQAIKKIAQYYKKQ